MFMYRNIIVLHARVAYSIPTPRCIKEAAMWYALSGAFKGKVYLCTLGCNETSMSTVVFVKTVKTHCGTVPGVLWVYVHLV